MTYFPALQYHRRVKLNFCVRDGNRCDLDPIVTDKSPPQWRPGKGTNNHVAFVVVHDGTLSK